jgi:hypothetical protein
MKQKPVGLAACLILSLLGSLGILLPAFASDSEYLDSLNLEMEQAIHQFERAAAWALILALIAGITALLISALQTRSNKYIRITCAVAGLVVGICTYIRTEIFPNGYRAYESAATDARFLSIDFKRDLERFRAAHTPEERNSLEAVISADAERLRQLHARYELGASGQADSPGISDHHTSKSTTQWIPISSAIADEVSAEGRTDHSPELVPPWVFSSPAEPSELFVRGLGRDADLNKALQLAESNAIEMLQAALTDVIHGSDIQLATLPHQTRTFFRKTEDGNYLAFVLLNYPKAAVTTAIANYDALSRSHGSGHRVSPQDAVNMVGDKLRYSCQMSWPGWTEQLSNELLRWRDRRDLFVGDNALDPSKMANARRAMSVPDTEKIMAQVDATLFGSAVNGVLLTDRGIYFRNGSLEKDLGGHLTYPELLGLDVTVVRHFLNPSTVGLGKDHYIQLAGSSVPASDLANLLQEVQHLARTRCAPEIPPQRS